MAEEVMRKGRLVDGADFHPPVDRMKSPLLAVPRPEPSEEQEEIAFSDAIAGKMSLGRRNLAEGRMRSFQNGIVMAQVVALQPSCRNGFYQGSDRLAIDDHIAISLAAP